MQHTIFNTIRHSSPLGLVGVFPPVPVQKLHSIGSYMTVIQHIAGLATQNTTSFDIDKMLLSMLWVLIWYSNIVPSGNTLPLALQNDIEHRRAALANYAAENAHLAQPDKTKQEDNNDGEYIPSLLLFCPEFALSNIISHFKDCPVALATSLATQHGVLLCHNIPLLFQISSQIFPNQVNMADPAVLFKLTALMHAVLSAVPPNFFIASQFSLDISSASDTTLQFVQTSQLPNPCVLDLFRNGRLHLAVTTQPSRDLPRLLTSDQPSDQPATSVSSQNVSTDIDNETLLPSSENTSNKSQPLPSAPLLHISSINVPGVRLSFTEVINDVFVLGNNGDNNFQSAATCFQKESHFIASAQLAQPINAYQILLDLFVPGVSSYLTQANIPMNNQTENEVIDVETVEMSDQQTIPTTNTNSDTSVTVQLGETFDDLELDEAMINSVLDVQMIAQLADSAFAGR